MEKRRIGKASKKIKKSLKNELTSPEWHDIIKIYDIPLKTQDVVRELGEYTDNLWFHFLSEKEKRRKK